MTRGEAGAPGGRDSGPAREDGTGAAAPTLRRLLTARAAEGLLAPLGPLLGRLRARLLRPDGTVHAEALGPSWVAVAAVAAGASWPLAVEGEPIAVLEIDPGPVGDHEHAVAGAVRAALSRALDDAYGRRMLATEALERYREVHLLYRVGEALAGNLDPAGVPQRVLREARGVIAAAGGGVWLAGHADGAANGTVANEDGTAPAIGAPTSDAPDDLVWVEGECPALDEVLARLADPGTAAILAAGGVAAGGGGHAGVGGGGGNATTGGAYRGATHLLWAPLMARETVLGAVWLARPASEAVFAAGDLKLLTALAAQAAAFVDNARLHQRALAQERMAQELELAYEVQARLMPGEMPARDGWEVVGFWRPAREVSGDFYDLLPRAEGLGVVVADVADKGMPAALFMAVVRSLLRAASTAAGPSQTVANVNRLAALDAADGMFVTLWYGVLEPDGGVRYVNAGHNPPLVVRSDGRVERLTRTGILVGWDPDAAYGEGAVALEPGDLLVAYTDGVTEARDAAGADFGEERLTELVRALRREGAPEVLAAVRGALDEFVGGAAVHDDCTLVVARRVTPPLGG